MAHAGGRPIEWTDERIQNVIKKLDTYIEDNTIPIIAEFAYQNDIRKAVLYEKEEFSYSIKRLIEKKEANLEKGMLFGKINVTGAIFSLKQLGWRDKSEIEHSGNISNEGKTEEELRKELEEMRKRQENVK
jgi:predicted CopG family antitoxin